MAQARNAKNKEGIALMKLLEEQINTQKSHFEDSLLEQLRSDIHLPQCVKIIGYLRRLNTYDDESRIREVFL